MDIMAPIILHEGLAVATHPEPHSWLLKHQAQSWDYALEHGGYAILEDDLSISRKAVMQGWRDFLHIAEGGAFSHDITRWTVTTIVATQRLALSADSTSDYLLAEQVIMPTLLGVRTSLNWLHNRTAAIAGELDSWVMATATKFGIDPDLI